MGINQKAGQNSMQKLSSGLRINKAGDDAAGLAISEKMRGQIRGLDQASRNAQDGISMIQTAEGALQETHSILQRMRELSVQSANDTNTTDDRNEIQKEIEQLKSEVNRISENTEFNTQKLLNGSLGAVATSSASANVEVTSATGLKVGNYTTTVTQQATKTATAAGTQSFENAVNVSTHDLSINGTKIDFSGMTTASKADVLAKINEYSAQTGVTATAGGTGDHFVVLSQDSFGSDGKIALSGTNAGLYGGAVTAGNDAKLSVASPEGVTQEFTGNGQSVSYNGAEFQAKGALNSTATISVTSSGATLHIGANKDQNMVIDMNEISTKSLGNITDGLVKDIDVRTQAGSDKAINTLDKAIQQVSAERSKLGAFQNRLDHTISNLGTSAENLQAAESRVRDVDMAREVMEMTKNNILSQASQAMLAQANQAPQAVLQLLG